MSRREEMIEGQRWSADRRRKTNHRDTEAQRTHRENRAPPLCAFSVPLCLGGLSFRVGSSQRATKRCLVRCVSTLSSVHVLWIVTAPSVEVSRQCAPLAMNASVQRGGVRGSSWLETTNLGAAQRASSGVL